MSLPHNTQSNQRQTIGRNAEAKGSAPWTSNNTLPATYLAPSRSAFQGVGPFSSGFMSSQTLPPQQLQQSFANQQQGPAAVVQQFKQSGEGFPQFPSHPSQEQLQLFRLQLSQRPPMGMFPQLPQQQQQQQQLPQQPPMFSNGRPTAFAPVEPGPIPDVHLQQQQQQIKYLMQLQQLRTAQLQQQFQSSAFSPQFPQPMPPMMTSIPPAIIPATTQEPSKPYKSVIECGVKGPDGKLRLKQWSDYFGEQVEVFTAVSDPNREVLFKASILAHKCGCATNKVAMYLARRRHLMDGIFQATVLLGKPEHSSGLKTGSYLVSLSACKKFEEYIKERDQKLLDRKQIAESIDRERKMYTGDAKKSASEPSMADETHAEMTTDTSRPLPMLAPATNVKLDSERTLKRKLVTVLHGGEPKRQKTPSSSASDPSRNARSEKQVENTDSRPSLSTSGRNIVANGSESLPATARTEGTPLKARSPMSNEDSPDNLPPVSVATDPEPMVGCSDRSGEHINDPDEPQVQEAGDQEEQEPEEEEDSQVPGQEASDGRMAQMSAAEQRRQHDEQQQRIQKLDDDIPSPVKKPRVSFSLPHGTPATPAPPPPAEVSAFTFAKPSPVNSSHVPVAAIAEEDRLSLPSTADDKSSSTPSSR